MNLMGKWLLLKARSPTGTNLQTGITFKKLSLNFLTDFRDSAYDTLLVPHL